MTVEELKSACAAAIDRRYEIESQGLPTLGDAIINLVLPGPATGFKRRLVGRRGPLGDIMCENVIDGRVQCVVNFNAKQVLDWIQKQEAPSHE